jgi:seryl-tRNA synthetase
MTQAPTKRQISLHNSVADLLRLQEWVTVGHEVHLGRGMLALMDWLDSRFVAFATKEGAKEMPVARFIERSVLETAGYSEAFSAEVVLDEAKGGFLSPATCYHCYAKLAMGPLPEPGIWTCITRCGRDEGKEELGRLRTFLMREIVLVGPANWLREKRQQWMDRIFAFARSLQMTVTLEPATDPFFSRGAARGMRLLQQLKQLKYELRARMDAGETELAIASFNLHETFFSRRFGFRLNNETETYSGCIAFGLERWALVLAIQLGPERAFKLSGREQK